MSFSFRLFRDFRGQFKMEHRHFCLSRLSIPYSRQTRMSTLRSNFF